eukprot:3302432-Pyramimonas_sp.AAC.2
MVASIHPYCSIDYSCGDAEMTHGEPCWAPGAAWWWTGGMATLEEHMKLIYAFRARQHNGLVVVG